MVFIVMSILDVTAYSTEAKLNQMVLVDQAPIQEVV